MGEKQRCNGSGAKMPRETQVLAIQAHVSGLRYFWMHCPVCGQEVESDTDGDGYQIMPHPPTGHPSWPRDKKRDRTAGLR